MMLNLKFINFINQWKILMQMIKFIFILSFF